MKKGILKIIGETIEVHFVKSQFKTNKYKLLNGAIDDYKSYNNCDVNFSHDEQGIVTEISFKNETIYTKNKILLSQKSKADYLKQDNLKKEKEVKKDYVGSKTDKFARSPYNFIPLNEKVLFNGEEAHFDKLDNDRFTGYLNIKVTNLTPLFLRQISDSEDNFGYGGKFGIPGSSFRGMIRTICEILGFAKFSFYNDRYPYFRGTLLSMEKIHAGVIKYDQMDRVFKIYKCSYNKENTERWQTTKIQNPVYQENRIIFTTGQFGKKVNNTYTIGFNKFEFFNIDENPSYEISKNNQIYLDYMDDKNAKKNPPLFDEKRAEKYPVFYQLTDDDKIKTIGTAKFHRIPYSKNIEGHIPEYLNSSETDIVERLFGIVSNDNGNIASRVSFGDLMSTDSELLKDHSYLLRILSSPKPTTYQHYLEQNDKSKIYDWDANNDIRGYKMYWHRNTKDDESIDFSWNESNGTNKTKSHTERIKPIYPNAIFTGKIWFTNLSKLELGLLLTALEPGFAKNEKERIVHKIGLGKPLGLGSIQVNVDSIDIMNLNDKEYFKSYNQSLKKVEKKDFMDHFKKELASKLKIHDIWSNDSLNELKTMLIWDENVVSTEDWLLKTRYMEINRGEDKNNKIKGENEFKERPVLPKPSQVVEMSNDKFQDKSKK